MKQKYSHLSHVSRWNILLKKLNKLYKKIVYGSSLLNKNELRKKFNKIYKRLEKMQYRVGVKIAGTAIALMLVSANVSAQNYTGNGEMMIDEETWVDGPTEATPAFADIDNDGDLDLYLGNYLGSIKVFYNNNDGTFEDGVLLFEEGGGSGQLVNYASAPAFADIDGDGDLDLYSGDWYGNINIFENNNGEFTNIGFLQANGSNIDVGFYATPTFADIDGDNDLDLYVGDWNDGFVRVFTNDNGSFSSAGNLQADGVDIDAGTKSAPTFADLDQDGDLDLYVGSSDKDIKIFTNDNGTFSSAGKLQADGVDIIVDWGPTRPFFINLDENSCGLELYIGKGNGRVNVYSQVDSESPSIAFENQTIDAGLNCDASLPDYTTEVTASDNCDNVLEYTQTPLPCVIISGGTNSVTVTVEDDAGLTNFVTFNVTVQESSAPAITSTHDDLIIDVDENCEATLPDYTTDVIATDNCDDDLTITQNPLAGETISGETNTITLTVEDDSGNIDFVTFNVAVEDNTAPVISSTHIDLTIGDEANCEATLADYTTEVVATDNCDNDLTITQNPIAGETISGATNTITLTVEDDAGNTDFVTFNIAVEDNSDPIITSTHDDATIEAVSNCEVALPDYTSDVVTTDNCDNELTITQNPTVGELISGTTNTITLTVEDDAGNTDFVTFNVAVEDNSAPVISSIHEDMILGVNENCEFILPDYTVEVVATDNCDNNITITQTPEAGQIISGTTNTITLTVEDDEGNSSFVSFNISVVDNTAPVISSTHNDLTIGDEANCEATLSDYTTEVVATDNCDNDLTITQNPIAGETISGATNTITLTVEDDSGNTDFVTFNIAVEDNTVPEISCIDNQNVTADATNFYIVQETEFDPIEFSDNCEVATIINDFNFSSTLEDAQLPEGTTTIVWTVTDNSGNENTCTFDVVVSEFVGIKGYTENEISIYPNPTTGKIIIDSKDLTTENISFSDVNGRTISYELISNNKQIEIDLSNENTGIYFLNIKTDETVKTYKIIKE